jgi:MFS family permease
MSIPREVRVLIAARAVNQFGAFSLPYMTVLLTTGIGASLTAAGIIVTAFGVATIPSRLAGGRLVAVLGHRRTIIAGLIGCAGAQVGLATSRSIAAATIFAILLGLLYEVYEPASQATIANAVAADHRVRAFGALNAALALASIGAGVLGAVVGRWNIRGLFWIDALTCLTCAVIVGVVMQPRSGYDAPAADPRVERVRPWRDPALVAMLGCGTVFALIYLTVAVGMPLTFVQHGHPAADAGWMFAVSGLTIVVGQPLLRRARPGRPSHAALPVGIIVLAVGLAGYVVAVDLAGFILATVIWSIGDVLIIGHAMAIVAALAPPHGRSQYLATYGISWGIAGVLAPVAATQVLARAGSDALWLGVGGLAVLLAALQAYVIRQVDKETVSPCTGSGINRMPHRRLAATQRSAAD